MNDPSPTTLTTSLSGLASLAPSDAPRAQPRLDPPLMKNVPGRLRFTYSDTVPELVTHSFRKIVSWSMA